MKLQEMKLKPALSGGLDWDIADLAKHLEEQKARQVYILDDGVVVGVVGMADIVYKAVAKKNLNCTAKDIMNSPVISAESTLSSKDAYFLMAHANIFMIPVIENGELRGEVSMHECFDAIKNK